MPWLRQALRRSSSARGTDTTLMSLSLRALARDTQ
jgi:hypothetical protein